MIYLVCPALYNFFFGGEGVQFAYFYTLAFKGAGSKKIPSIFKVKNSKLVLVLIPFLVKNQLFNFLNSSIK